MNDNDSNAVSPSTDRSKGRILQLQDSIAEGQILLDEIRKNMHNQGIAAPPGLSRAEKLLSDADSKFGVFLEHDEKGAAAAASGNVISSAFHKSVASVRFREAARLEKGARSDMTYTVLGSRRDHGFDPETGDPWP